MYSKVNSLKGKMGTHKSWPRMTMHAFTHRPRPAPLPLSLHSLNSIAARGGHKAYIKYFPLREIRDPQIPQIPHGFGIAEQQQRNLRGPDPPQNKYNDALMFASLRNITHMWYLCTIRVR